MTNVEIFQIVSERLINCAPTKKGKDFALNLSNKIKSQGDDWIESHAQDLQLPCSLAKYSQETGEIAPIEDNRMFYLQKWQLAFHDFAK